MCRGRGGGGGGCCQLAVVNSSSVNGVGRDGREGVQTSNNSWSMWCVCAWRMADIFACGVDRGMSLVSRNAY